MKTLKWAALAVCLVTSSLALANPNGGGKAQTVIRTTQGATYKGKVLRETEQAVVLELRRGKISAELTIPKDQISSRGVEGGPTQTVLRLKGKASQARLIEDPRERGAALLAVAEELVQDGDPAEAARIYLEAAKADPGLRDQAEVAAARAYVSANRLPEAERTLERTLKRNPKHARAKAVARELERALAAKAERLLEPGLAAYMDRKPHRALRLLTDATKQLPRRVLDEASARTEREFGLSLAEVMVDCRMQAVCRDCEGAGVKPCPAADDNTNVRCRFGRRSRATKVERVGKIKLRKWERCKDCDGRGHLRCRACDGLGLHLTQPSEFEREALTSSLQGRIGAIEKQVGKLTDTVEKDKREDAVRSVAATELLGSLQELRSYARALTKLDPRAGAVGGANLRRKGELVGRRTAAIMVALANALFVGGEKRFEDAVDVSKEQVSPFVRSMRARQAWEAVNQARLFTLEALELDPRIAGPTLGDARRRLKLMDRFLRRTWVMYQVMTDAERNPGNNALEDLFGQANSLAGGQGRGRGNQNSQIKLDGSNSSSSNGRGSAQ